MKLYIISQDENNGWDTYDSAIVSANSEDEAKKIDPSGHRIWNDKDNCWMFTYANGKEPTPDYYYAWVNSLDAVSVEEIGEYNGTESKVILASFNAG